MMNRIVALLLHLLVCAGCVAQTLSVNPVNLSFPAGEHATKLTITNTGDRATSMQLRVYKWDQTGDTEEALVPSSEVQISPPITTVAPGATQLVRIVLRNTPTTRESTYRIILDQIPPPPVAGAIHVVLRLSIPVFAQPLNHALPRLQFHLEQKGNDLFLTADNDGGAHAKLRDLVIDGENGTKWTLKGLLPYVLAGSTRTWRLTSSGGTPSGKPLFLNAASDAGPVHETLPVPSTQVAATR